MLSIGQSAPKLLGKDQNGHNIRVEDFAGKKLILFFYPKDNTPTCTKEACNFRDNYALLQSKGLAVVGVCIDGAKSHQKFITKHSLPFPLIVDEDKEWVQAYGVWAEKQMFGRKYMGTKRTTFVLDEKGNILHIISKVKSAEHTQQILTLLGL